jgi:hypothetical protein
MAEQAAQRMRSERGSQAASRTAPPPRLTLRWTVLVMLLLLGLMLGGIMAVAQLHSLFFT